MFHKRLMQEFRDNMKYVAGMVATQWLMLIANVFFMYTLAGFISSAADGTAKTADLQKIFIVLACVIAVRAVSTYVNSRLSFAASCNVKSRIRKMVYEKLMRFSGSYREHLSSAEAVQISTEGVEQLEIYFGKYVPQFFYSMLAPLTLFVIVGMMNWTVAVVLLICVPLIPVSIIAVQKFAKKMLAKYWGTYTELGDSFLESLQGLTTLKIYSADERYAKKMDEEAEKFRKVTMRVLIMQLNSISIMDLVAYGGAALGIALSLLKLKNGAVTLTECFFIIMISAEFFLPLRMLGSFFHIAMNGNAAADKIFKLLDTKEPEEGSIKETEGQTICFENISFSYTPEKQVLKEVSFSTKERGITALVGTSGCGKSTITSLLMKENRPQSGVITLGGEVLSDFTTEGLMKKITRITHDSYIFKGTVRENLAMGCETASEPEMREALEQVDLLGFVEENGGLDMEILEKGANLSGGQKQRLALARALLHDSPVYIFDEATSNVDVESENKIMEIVQDLAREKSVILISHRLANVTAADKILYMEQGKIAESGTHEQLMAQNKAYAALFNKQQELEHFREEAV